MTRDEVKRLVGGYATGSLTEEERKALFDAALEDQELFDALADEQALKETIEAPGVRGRLIGALQPAKPQPAWWKRPWPIAVAATFAMGVMVGIAIWPKPKPANTVVAITQSQPQPADPRPVEVDRLKPLPREVRNAPAPQPTRRQLAQTPPVRDAERNEKTPTAAPLAAGTPATAPAPPPPPQQVAERKPDAAKGSEPAQAKSENAVGQQAGVVGGVAPFVPQQQAQQQQAQQQSAQQIPQLPTGTQTDDLKKNLRQREAGFGGGSGGVRSAKLAGSRADSRRFGFRYRFDQQGQLEITPLSQGYLTVRGVRFGASEKVFPADKQGRLPAGTPVYIPIPAQMTEVEVVFAASQALADEVAAVKSKDADLAKQLLPAGTAEDPTPSINSRVSVTLTVPKR